MLLACVMAFYVFFCFQAPSLPEKGIAGKGLLHIVDLVKVARPFGTESVLKGHLRNFEGEGVRVDEVKVTLLLKGHGPNLKCNWWVTGKLKGDIHRGYTFKPASWEEGGRTWSLASLRSWWRLHVREFLRGRLQARKSADFLTGMLTGEFVDVDLFFAFNRLGLQHLMAISGFHFSLIAAFFSKILALCLSRRSACLFSLGGLALYFALLTPGAAVIRAFVMAFVHHFGSLLGRKVDPLNALGVAMGVLLLISPLSIASVGFHYSFACTAALLLFYSPLDGLFARFLGRQGKKEVLKMEIFDQHGFALLALSRRALALMVAINLVVIPLTLFHFGQFPWLSLLYNLFFPTLVAFAMGVGVPLLLLPWGALVLERIIRWTLDFARYFPAVLEGQWKVEQVPLWLLVSYFCLILTPVVLSRKTGTGTFISPKNSFATCDPQKQGYLPV